MAFRWWWKKQPLPAVRKRETVSVTYPTAGNVQLVRTPFAAMQIATAYSCITAIADSLARTPLLYQRWNDSKQCYVDNHAAPLYWLLKHKPSERMTPATMFHTIAVQLLTQGNAYIVPVRDDSGNPAELVLVSNPDGVFVDVYNNRYHITDPVHSSSNGTYDAVQILHFQLNPDPTTGKGRSVIEYARKTLEVAATANSENAKRFANGGRVKAIYHQEDDGRGGFTSGVYDNTEMKSSGDDIEEQIQSGKDIITVPGAGKLDPLAMTSADMQFLESMKFSVAEICRFFRVPRSIVMDDTNSNYKSSEQATAQFYQFALAPMMRMIADEFNAKLVYDSVREYYRFTFDTAALYSADPLTQAEYQAKMLGNGYTVNELRAMNNLAAVKGGDAPILSANVKTITEITEGQG